VSKTVKILIALALAMVVASPAMAAFKLNGYYRLQATSENFETAAGSQQNTASFIDNRLRFKMTNQLNDYVSVVYYMEVDTPWGESSKGGIGGGGKRGADGVNVETKNAFVDFKIPDTSLKLRTGLQGGGIGGNFASLVEDDDMAAAKLTGKLGMANFTLLYSKWDEGKATSKDTTTYAINNGGGAVANGDTVTATTTTATTDGGRKVWDDVDYYAADVNAQVNEQFKIGGSLAYIDDNSTAFDVEETYAGVYGNYAFGNMAVSSFFLYGDFTNDDPAKQDGSSVWFDAAGKMKLDNGYVKVHFAYTPDDDDANEVNTFNAAKGGFEYHSDNMSLFLTDVYYNNGTQGALALKDAAYKGYGLWFLTVSGKVDLPQDYYARYALGYFSALEDTTNGDAATKKTDTDLGTEIDAMVGKKFAEKYDVSLRGSYGLLGDFYSVAGKDDADDIYKVVAMVNVSF